MLALKPWMLIPPLFSIEFSRNTMKRERLTSGGPNDSEQNHHGSIRSPWYATVLCAGCLEAENGRKNVMSAPYRPIPGAGRRG